MNKKTLCVTLIVLAALLAGCRVEPTPTPVVQKIIEKVIITATPMDTPPPADTATPIVQTVVQTVIHTVVVTATPAPVTPTIAPTPTPEPGSSMDLSGPDGTMTLSIDQLQAMPVTEGWAGTKSSTGRISPPAYFKGVSVIDLCNRIGTFSPEIAVNLVAKDGYAMTFSYAQLSSGSFTAFDPGTGQEIAPPDDLQVIVAYERDGEPIPGETHGPLRLAVVSDTKEQVTDSHWSIKWIRQLEVKPAAAEWTLHLEGTITEEMDRNTFESGSSPSCHLAEWTDDEGHVWGGIPLYYLMGRVDDANSHEGDAFDYDRAREGYEVQVIAADGYAVTLDSDPLARNRNILVANLIDGEPLPDEHFPLRLVGKDLTEGQMVSAIAQIVLDLPLADEAPIEPTREPAEAPAETTENETARADSMEPGILHVYGKVGEPIAFSVAALEQIGVVEIAAEHPKKGLTSFSGVRLNEILGACVPAENATILLCTAADGYSTEIPLANVQACADCMLQIDGESFGLIMPGLMTNTWVKDVLLIEVK